MGCLQDVNPDDFSFDGPVEWSRIVAYLDGGGTPAERAATRRWIAAMPGRAEAMDALERAWAMARTAGGAASSPRTTNTLDLPAAWVAMARRAGITVDGASRTGAVRPSTSLIRGPEGRTARMGIARRAPSGAALSRDRGTPSRTSRDAVASAGAARGVNRRLVQTISAALCAGVLAAAFIVWFGVRGRTAPASNTYSSAPGQYTTIDLSHGSRALLGPSTTVTVAADAATGRRVATVQGEALFTITHDRHTPFSVRTGHAIIDVLGTAFVVRHYASDAVARVVVTEGRVSLRGANDTSAVGQRTVLASRMLGTVDDSGRVLVTPNIAVDDYTAWTGGRLIFDKTPMRDIAAELGRVYGVDIRLADSSLAARTLTWTVPVTQQSLDDVLAAVTTILGAHATRSGHTIVIVPDSTKSRGSLHRLPLRPQENLYGR